MAVLMYRLACVHSATLSHFMCVLACVFVCLLKRRSKHASISHLLCVTVFMCVFVCVRGCVCVCGARLQTIADLFVFMCVRMREDKCTCVCFYVWGGHDLQLFHARLRVCVCLHVMISFSNSCSN
jgi:hypothetical protein